MGFGLSLALDGRDAIDADYVRAKDAGADVVWDVGDTEWGSYRFRVRDLEGREWTSGTHPARRADDW